MGCITVTPPPTAAPQALIVGGGLLAADRGSSAHKIAPDIGGSWLKVSSAPFAEEGGIGTFDHDVSGTRVPHPSTGGVITLSV
jgi:hypothetical protein